MTKVIDNIKNGLKRILVERGRLAVREFREIRHWERLGRSIPPPHIYKQKVVKYYAKKFALHTFIETGTFKGDMVFAMKNIFTKIYSIELGENLYIEAKERFSEFSHIQILHGDSAVILPKLLMPIDDDCLFWLDGHYSSGITARGSLDTPIREEIKEILKSKSGKSVLLIDDARLFNGKGDYPTLEELERMVMRKNPQWVLEVKEDIIRVHARF